MAISEATLALMKKTCGGVKQSGLNSSGFSDAYAGTTDNVYTETPQVNYMQESNGYGYPEPKEEEEIQYLTEEQMLALRGSMQGQPRPVSAKPMVYKENPKSNLPDAIKEVLRKTSQIEMPSSALNPGVVGPRLTEKAKQLINESQRPQNTNVQPTQAYAPAQGVDYTIIKGIIEECIDRKLREYSQTMLNENRLQQINIKNGKIKLVDSKGNVYGADLEYLKNINDKKK